MTGSLNNIIESLKSRPKRLGFLGGSVFAIISALHITTYIHYTKLDSPETDVLNRVAVSLQNYEDRNEQGALEFAEETLELIADGSIHIQELAGLQQEVYRLQENIRISGQPNAYRSDLNHLGESIEGIADKYGKDNAYLWLGVAFGVVSLLWFGLTCYAYLTERKRSSNDILSE